MANTSITLELRQADATKLNFNGDYENQLARQVTIEDGDIVQLKSIFLDTIDEQNINIIDDLTLTLVNGVYITDWYYNDDYKQQWKNLDGSIPDSDTVSPSGNNYVAYKATGIPTNDVELVNYYIFDIIAPPGLPSALPTVSDLPINFTYLDADGDDNFLPTTGSWVNYQGTDLPQNPKYQLWIPINVIVKNGTFKPVDIEILDIQGLQPNSANTSPVSQNETYVPWLFTTNISLPRGSYTTADISTIISKELSRNGAVTDTNMVNSNFLFECSAFDIGQPYPDGSPGTIAIQSPFITSNIVNGTVVDAKVFKFVIDKKMFVGASQMALEFNADNNKFNFTYMHTPMYDSTNGDTISVRYINKYLNPANELVAVTTNGGAFFTSMSARDTKGNLVDFWGGQLGFNVGAMCANISPPAELFGDPTSKYYLVENLVPGVNITGGYTGLDTAVIKGANTWYIGQVPKADTPADLQNGISSTLNDTVGILAPKNYTLLVDSFSHYLLQLDINFYNTFIGVDNWRNLNAIVNKYYNYGNYTFGDPDSALTYTHKGAPLTIKSVKTRILTPDKKLDKGLGADNTVYLTIIKPVQSMPVQ